MNSAKPSVAMARRDSADQATGEAALRENERVLRELTLALEHRVKERTAELSMSEAKFRALFERTSQGVVLHDENQILEINPAAVRILGRHSALELLGKHPGDFSPPCQPSGEPSDIVARKYIAETMDRGSARFEWTAAGPGGQEIPLEIYLTRIAWSGRQTIQAFITDISERKRAQTALAESEARFSAAFQASPVFITISRMDDGRYVLANEAFLKWTAYRLEEVLRRNSEELALWAEPAERAPFWEELRRSRFIRERECRVRNRHGRIFTMLISADIIEVNGEPHLLTVGLDISERKRAEAERKQTETELHRTVAREKELSQLKSNFVSMVSHEFRTPLGIIQSSAELLRDFYQRMPSSEREDQLESIIRNTRRMAGMMEEVLVLSRLDAGKLEFRPAPLDLISFCRRVVNEVLSATNHRCHIEFASDSEPPRVEADERLLGHIFTNLLSNAVKYSEPGATIRFSMEHDESHVVCVVRDEGIGIPEEDRPRLFEAFFRGSNVGPRPGTGLGLLLVKRCAELHVGQVFVSSKVGEGTTVTVKFPISGTNDEKNTGH
jgi:PAS domain S-box-containing protein